MKKAYVSSMTANMTLAARLPADHGKAVASRHDISVDTVTHRDGRHGNAGLLALKNHLGFKELLSKTYVHVVRYRA